MNKWLGLGRLCADPTEYTTRSGSTVVRYRIAIDRVTGAKTEKVTDFIPCVAFGKTGQFAGKYLRRGMLVGIEGTLRTSEYEKDGVKVKGFEIAVERQFPCTWKSDESSEGGFGTGYGTGYGASYGTSEGDCGTPTPFGDDNGYTPDGGRYGDSTHTTDNSRYGANVPYSSTTSPYDPDSAPFGSTSSPYGTHSAPSHSTFSPYGASRDPDPWSDFQAMEPDAVKHTPWEYGDA